MRTLLAGLLLLLLPAALRAQVAALVIGHGSPQRIEQATAVAEVLRAVAPDATVRLLVGAEATSSSVRGALFQLLARRPSDVLVYAATDVTLQRYPSGGETGWMLLEGSRPADQPSDVPESALGLQPVVAQLAASSARRVVLALDTRFAGLAVPAAPVTPDTFFAVIAGPAAEAFPLGEAIYAADSYGNALARLHGVETAIRQSLQPARSIARTLRPDAATAALVLPLLPPGTTVEVDGRDAPGGALRLEPGDHTLVVALNALPLWRTSVVLASEETRRLQTAVDLRQPVRLVRSADLSGGRLRVNGVSVPDGDTVSVAPGRLWIEASLPGLPERSGGAFALPGQIVHLSEGQRFDATRILAGALVPGLNPLRDRQPAKALLVVGAVAGSGAFAYLSNRNHHEHLSALADAQQAYDQATGEANTAAARQALDAAYADAQASHRWQKWGVRAVAATLTLNLVDAWLNHGRTPFLRLTVSPMPR